MERHVVRRVLQLVGRGRSNGEIAQELLDGTHGDCGPTDAASAVARGWAAFTAKTKVDKP